LLGICQRQV